MPHTDQYLFACDEDLSENFRIIEIRQLIDFWNGEIDKNHFSKDEIWNVFDLLKEKFPNKLLLINKAGNKFQFRIYCEIYERMTEFMRKKQFPTNCYEDWLIFRGKIEGISPFIPIIAHTSNGRSDQYLVLNTNSKWNKYGLERFKKYAKHNNQKFTFFRIIAKELSIIDKPDLKAQIIEKLEKNGYSYPLDIKDQYKRWFQSIFKLKITEGLLDEILEILFWKHVENFGGDAGFRNHAKDSPQKQRIFKFYNNNRSILNFYTERDPEPDNSFETEVYICDKSELMFNFWLWLLKENFPKSNWWEEVKNIPATIISRKIQSLKIKHSKPIGITYSLRNAKLTQFKDISDDSTIFYNESRNNSFNRFNAAFIQDMKIREAITRKTKEFSDINHLDLSKKVVSEDRWGRISSGESHLIGKPDIITYELGKSGEKREAREIIQNKLMREIGSHKGSISSRDYLLDFLKTIGHFDISRGTGTLKLQLEYIRRGYSVGGLTNISKNNNVIILSYWGKSNQKMQRWGDIIAAVILRKYRNGFTEEKSLISKLLESLKHGTEALNGRKIDSVSRSFVKRIIGDTNLGETNYLKDQFLEFIRFYAEIF